MQELVRDKVYYKIFDKSYKDSSHVYAKYKANSETKIAEINQNLENVKKELEANKILVLQQVHGNLIVDADEITDFNLEPVADGVVTSIKNLALTIQTADCVPVLLGCKEGVIGAAHCGWRSAKSNIVVNLVKMMKEKGALEIAALIGPCIAQESYEIDQDYYDGFINDSKDYAKFFIPSIKPTHYMFDLPSFVEHKLKESGVDDITRVFENTYSMPEKYPSYRKSFHLGEKYSQNILSTILIK